MSKVLLLKKDAIDLCKSLPDNSVDLFLYDPPYTSDLKTMATYDLSIGHRKTYKRTMLPFILLSKKPFHEYIIDLLKVQYSKLKESGNVVIIATDKLFYSIWRDIPSDYYYLITIYWYKPSGGPQYRVISFKKISNNTWPILVLCKNKSKHYDDATTVMKYLNQDFYKTAENTIRKIIGNVWTVKIDRKFRYYTAKPINLLRALIECFCPENGLVVDCFCGSGSTGEASLLSNRRAILSDISDDAIDATKIRLLPYKLKLQGGKNVRSA